MKLTDDKLRTIITYLLLTGAILAVIYDVTQNPQAGRECKLSDSYGNTIIGNCSWIVEYYHSQQNIMDYMNLVGRLEENNKIITTTTTTTTETTTTIIYVKVENTPTPTTQLKHQGNMSSNLATTTSSTSTLPTIYDYMLYCNTTADCNLTSGCCPCTAGGKVIAMNKNYIKSWKQRLNCPISIKCLSSLKPCENYKAECINNTCTKTIQ